MYYLILNTLGYGEEREVEKVEVLFSSKPFNKTTLDREYEGWYWNWMRRADQMTRYKQLRQYKMNHSFSYFRKRKGFKKVRDNRIQFTT